jgi:hypothetical protein
MATEKPAGPDPDLVARLATQKRKFKDSAKQLTAERKDLRKQVETLTAQLEKLSKETPAGKVQELETQLRTLKHRGVFDRLARDRGAPDDVLDDLFVLLKYQADKDEPDEAAIAKLLDAAAEHPSRSRFFAAWDDDDDDQGGAEPESEPSRTDREEIAPGRRTAPDAGRGGRPRESGGVTLTRDQLADPRFMLDPKNAELKKTAKIRI